MNEIFETIKKAQQERRENLVKGFVQENEDTVETQQQTSDDSEDQQAVEKSDVLYALNQNDSDIKFEKTGKEIKEKANELMDEYVANLATKKSEASALLEDCGDAPTHDVPEYMTADMKFDVGYKRYDWPEMSMEKECVGCGMYDTLSPEQEQKFKKNYAANEIQAESRRKYNDKVYEICNIMIDIKACEMLQSLDDNKKYKLTPKQFVVLRF